MPKVVEIPGVGTVEFPDTMRDEEIAFQIRKSLAPKQPEKRGYWQGVWDELPSPQQVVQGLAQATSQPLTTLSNLSGAQWEMLNKADKAMDQGNYLKALRHGVEFALPVVGPAMSHLGDAAERGEPAYALGGATVQGLMNVLPNPALRGRQILKGIRHPNQMVADAYDYLAAQGATIPAGTRVGNKQAMVMEQAAAQTFGGSRVAQAVNARNADVLRRTSQGLATEAHPVPVDPYGAGEDVRRALVQDSDAAAAALEQEGGYLANRVHPQPVVPLQSGTDLRAAAEGRVAELSEQADAAYDPFHQAARNPANRRTVPVGVDQNGRNIVEDMALPVNIQQLQNILRPLVREWEMLVEPARRHSSAGFTAMRSILDWDRGHWMPAELAEKALGGLKTLTRTGKYETRGGEQFARVMRDQNQGVASMAARHLQDQIDAAVAQAAPDAARGLQEGRRFTAQKFDVADNVVSKMLQEPAQAYKQMTYAGDSGIDYVRTVARELPQEMPKVGRAFMGELLEQASTPAGWKTAKRRWDALGDETKRIYYSDPSVRADIDGFFEAGLHHADNDIVRSLAQEPVGVYRQLARPDDAGVGLLSKVEDIAPQEMPKMGRAILTDIFEDATREGGWIRAAGIKAKWDALGQKTKEKVFRNPMLRQNLERFFLAQKELAERVNKSETAMTGVSLAEKGLWLAVPGAAVSSAVTGNPLHFAGALATAGMASLTGYQLAKLLYSPRGTELLMKGLRTPAGKGLYNAPLAAEMLKIIGESDEEKTRR